MTLATVKMMLLMNAMTRMKSRAANAPLRFSKNTHWVGSENCNSDASSPVFDAVKMMKANGTKNTMLNNTMVMTLSQMFFLGLFALVVGLTWWPG